MSRYYTPGANEYRVSKVTVNMFMAQNWNRMGKEGFKVSRADPGLILRISSILSGLGGGEFCKRVSSARSVEMDRVNLEHIVKNRLLSILSMLFNLHQVLSKAIQ